MAFVLHISHLFLLKNVKIEIKAFSNFSVDRNSRDGHLSFIQSHFYSCNLWDDVCNDIQVVSQGCQWWVGQGGNCPPSCKYVLTYLLTCLLDSLFSYLNLSFISTGTKNFPERGIQALLSLISSKNP